MITSQEREKNVLPQPHNHDALPQILTPVLRTRRRNHNEGHKRGIRDNGITLG